MAMVSKGFTLLELLITISIIGILVAAGSVSFTTAQKRGRDARRQGDIQTIQKSLEQCYILENKYPQQERLDFGEELICGDNKSIMSVVPEDPLAGANYYYTTDTDGLNYCLCAELERVGAGNANSSGNNGSCSFNKGSESNYYCVSNQQ